MPTADQDPNGQRQTADSTKDSDTALSIGGEAPPASVEEGGSKKLSRNAPIPQRYRLKLGIERNGHGLVEGAGQGLEESGTQLAVAEVSSAGVTAGVSFNLKGTQAQYTIGNGFFIRNIPFNTLYFYNDEQPDEYIDFVVVDEDQRRALQEPIDIKRVRSTEERVRVEQVDAPQTFETSEDTTISGGTDEQVLGSNSRRKEVFFHYLATSGASDPLRIRNSAGTTDGEGFPLVKGQTLVFENRDDFHIYNPDGSDATVNVTESVYS